MEEPKALLFSNRKLKNLIVPLIIEQMLLVTVSVTNTIMVANLGEYAVSAVSLVESINLLLMNIFAAMATGGAVVVAQYLGSSDFKEAKISAKQLVLITGLFSLLIMAVCLFLNGALLRLMFGNIEFNVMEAAKVYFFYSALSYPFLALYNAGAAIFRAMGNSKISMINSMIMNVINVSLSAVFIFVFKLGVFGVVLATLIARIISSVVMLYMLSKRENAVYIKNYFHYTWEFRYIKKILAIGVPSGLENSMFQLGKIVVQGLITTFGTYALAANAVGNTIANIMLVPGLAIGLSMVTVVGHCIGADAYDQAVYYIKKLMKIAYALMFSVSIVVGLTTPLILNIFSLSPEAELLVWQCILVHVLLGTFFWPASFTLPSALRAANDAKFTMMVSIFSMWVFRYLFSFVLAVNLELGLVGVWLAMVTDWIFRASVFVWRYYSGKWKHRKLV